MASVTSHYADHLAPVYVWMAGGVEAALEVGAADLADYLPGRGVAIDLGAGFGMHSIPLARSGYVVTAIDSSSFLLQVLRDRGAGLPLRALEQDLLQFRRAAPESADLIVCMGDTLTHLESPDAVEQLCAEVAAALSPRGRFVATFRDYTTAAVGEKRFVPVRSDADRILTCYLEVLEDRMLVHDLIHERDGAGWSLKVSNYRKLRLAPDTVVACLQQHGLSAGKLAGPRGMVRIEARA